MMTQKEIDEINNKTVDGYIQQMIEYGGSEIGEKVNMIPDYAIRVVLLSIIR